jgi:amino acid transporter
MVNIFRKKSIVSILNDANAGMGDSHGMSLKRVLGVRDLTALGGSRYWCRDIFQYWKGCIRWLDTGVVFLYIFTAVACGFAALCYAEFASTVPVSGSAYTYSYVAFGEIFAWIVGWDLLMEYAIGNIAVAISWSDYFTNLVNKAGIHIPDWLTMDYMTAHAGFEKIHAALSSGANINSLNLTEVSQYYAWINAPMLGSLRMIIDLPAMLIVVLITYIVYVGIKESRTCEVISWLVSSWLLFYW